MCSHMGKLPKISRLPSSINNKIPSFKRKKEIRVYARVFVRAFCFWLSYCFISLLCMFYSGHKIGA